MKVAPSVNWHCSTGPAGSHSEIGNAGHTFCGASSGRVQECTAEVQRRCLEVTMRVQGALELL